MDLIYKILKSQPTASGGAPQESAEGRLNAARWSIQGIETRIDGFDLRDSEMATHRNPPEADKAVGHPGNLDWEEREYNIKEGD